MQNKIKKVLIICSVYKPNVGGIETVIEQLIEEYKKRGIKTVILTKKFPSYLSEKDVYNETKIYRIDRPKIAEDFKKTREFLDSIESEIRADVVHLIGVRRPMPIISLSLAKKWGVPFIANYAGGDLPDEHSQDSIEVWNEGKDTVKPALMFADEHISFSRSLSSLVKRNISKNISVKLVYGGINVEEIKKTKQYRCKNPYFCTVRRLDYEKGVDILLRAFFQVLKQHPNTNLIIAGDGPERQNLENLANKLNIQNKVKFLGYIEHKKALSIMKGSIAHVCPSRQEGGGLVNIEASACGTLPVGSNTGGIPEYIINDNTGLLFKSENEKDLTKIMLKILDNPDKRTQIIKVGKKWSNNFSWQNIAGQYLKIYNESGNPLKKVVPQKWSGDTEKIYNILKD